MWDNLRRLGEDVNSEEDDQNNKGENRKWLHGELNGTFSGSFNVILEIGPLFRFAYLADAVRDLEALGLGLSRACVFVRAPGAHGGNVVFN